MDFQRVYVLSTCRIYKLEPNEYDRLQRNKDGKFNDADIAKILQDATQARAGAYKARGIPTALRVIEIMGIEQSRKWGACSVSLSCVPNQGLLYLQ